MTRLLLGSLLAALATFVWGFLFWATPLSAPMMSSAPAPEALRAGLSEQLTETGVYFVPDMSVGEEAFMEQHAAGPVATVFFRREGANPMAAGTFVAGFLHMLVTAFLIGLLLRGVSASLPTYARRVAFVALAGLAVAIWSDLRAPVWFFQPWTYHLGSAIYDLVAWTVAGLVLARFVTPAVQPSTVSAQPVGA